MNHRFATDGVPRSAGTQRAELASGEASSTTRAPRESGAPLIAPLAFAVLVSPTTLWAASAPPLSPTNIFAPVSTPADSIFELSMFVLAVTAAIFVTVFGLLAYAVVRFRRKANDDGTEPPQVYGSYEVELAWTIIPVLIVVALFLATARVIADTQHPPKPRDALDVVVIGHQFWGEYRYPALGVVTANELHVPVSDPAPTPTFLTLSADTDHSFWCRVWPEDGPDPEPPQFDVDRPARDRTLPGQCAQCGNATRQDAAPGVRRLARGLRPLDRSATPTGTRRRRGSRPASWTTACVNCHAVGGSGTDGRFDGSDALHEPRHHRVGRGSEHAGESPAVDHSGRHQARIPDAGDERAPDVNAVATYLESLH